MTRCKGLPFYRPRNEERSFWYELGAPISQIDGKPSPLHDYQQEIVNKLLTDRHVMILKCRQSGLSDLGLRLILWQILSNGMEGNFLGICSTNIELSKDMARRMKSMLSPHGVYFDEKESVLTFPNARISWHSSEADNVRGFVPSMVVLDEFGMAGFDSSLFSVVDSFSIKKKDVYIYGITTPSRVNGPAHKLWTQKNSLYTRIEVPWQRVVNKMFSAEQLQRLKETSPSFSQEMECRWGFNVGVGTTFLSESVDKAIVLGQNVQVVEQAPKYLGIDIGLSSPFGYVIVQVVDGFAQVIHAEEVSQKAITGDHSDQVQKAVQLINQYQVQKVYCDGSAVSYIRSLKLAVGDMMPYENQIEQNRKMKLADDFNMLVSPVNFSTRHRDMLLFLKMLMDKGGLAVPARFTELIEFLRTCRDQDMAMVKRGASATNYNHCGDALRMSLLGTEFEDSEVIGY